MKKSRLILSFLILSCFSCAKKSGFEVRDDMIIISPEETKVDEIYIDKWKVGALGKQIISKGIRVSIKLPLLEKKQIKLLNKKSEMDAWIIKIKQHSMYRSQNIGHIYFPLMTPGQSSPSGLRVKQLKKGMFGIHYSASAVSSRLAKLNCPAFNHKFKVEKTKVENNSTSVEKIYISKAQSRRVKARVEKFENRIILNGGDRLRGDYYFQLAAYNSLTKKRLSNWIDVSGRAVVGQDKIVNIKGCTNAKVPLLNGPDARAKKNFKFGQ